MQSEINDMGAKYLAIIDEQETTLNHTITEIEETIVNLRNLMDISDVCLVSEYKSRNAEFRHMPAKFEVSLPTFTPQKINREQIHEQLGFLSKLTITKKEHGGSMKTPSAVYSHPVQPFVDEPRILSDMITEYGTHMYNALHNMSCLSDNELWTSGQDEILRLYNLQGEKLKSIQTKSGTTPSDIAVTQSQDLLYIDPYDNSINIVKNTQIQPLITLWGWSPLNLCSTSSGDLLIIMISDDRKQAKVVRYSGCTEKQTIQWDDQDQPLYSSINCPKYLTENRNLDICMADSTAHAVVVVNAAGKFRFRYTGNLSTRKDSFQPASITTDSQSKILITDFNNHYIQILDQDGHFLHYIDNCCLQCPMGLCMDSQDNLFVADLYTGKVKKIQYYK